MKSGDNYIYVYSPIVRSIRERHKLELAALGFEGAILARVSVQR